MTLKEKVKFFKEEINRYVNLFGLLDYQIYIEEDDDKDTKAYTIWREQINNKSIGRRIITFGYSTYWLKMEDTKEKEISSVAFHEVLELLFAKLRDLSLMQGQYISEREVDDEVHSIIRRMENVIFPKLFK